MVKAFYSTGIIIIILAAMSQHLASQAFVLNGSTTSLGGNCYQLTPDASGLAASMFSQNTIDLTQPFNLDATLFFGCKDANGADGIVFIFATSNTALGTGGGGIGYQGITPSLAIEYDDYFNSSFNDPPNDHVAVISMGNVDHGQATNLAGPTNLSNIEDCMDHCFFINWNPATLTLTATLDDDIITYTGDIVANIFGGNSQVYYGFSAGTGSLSNLHRVCFGPPVLEAMPDVSICEGTDIELQADPNGIAWDWAPDPTLSPLNVSNPTATPLVTTTYTTIIEYACGYLNYDTVQVIVIPEPVAFATNNGPVCEGESLTLMSSGGTSYTWSGPMGYSSSQQNPVINNISAGMAGYYYVTVTDAAGCTSETFTEVEIDLGPVITIDPLPALLCVNNSVIQLNADPVGGTWSGDISPDGIFDPSYAGEGVHTVTYTATNANGCTNSESVSIEVFSIPDVIINPPGTLCEDADPVQMTGNPPGGIWSGEISLNGLFDPGDAGEGIHLITYTANDANGCTNSEEILIEVVQNLPAEISPQGPFCLTDQVITLTATPSGGNWGGAADASGNINPVILGAGFHGVTYTLTNQDGCYYAQLNIEIINQPQVTIEEIGPLCLNESPQSLNATPAGGIWSGAADASGMINPAGLGIGNHEVIYTYNIAGGCAGADTITVQVLNAPQVGNLNITCDSLSTSFIVSFTISGGDPLSYSVTGSATGTLLPGNPYIFISQPIPSASSYLFVVSDINQCDSTTITGSYECNCETNAGMMNLNAITACEGDAISVLPPIGVVLDPDDTLSYVLHLGFPDSIILISESNEFIFGPPLQTGVIYFISTIAGNMGPGGSIDLTDPCLSVSFGTPVSWVENPTGYLTGPDMICNGDSASISFVLPSGVQFDIVYSDGSDSFAIDNISSGHSITVFPVTTTEYSLLEVTNVSSPGCSSVVDTSIIIEVPDNILTSESASICKGDSIFLSNSFQLNSGVYYDTLSSTNGCDSIIATSLLVNNSDTTFINTSSCDSSQVGINVEITNDLNGCDSTIITTVDYVEVDTTLIQSSTCDQQTAGIFNEWYTSQDGCDSLVIETVQFILPDTTSLNRGSCNEAQAGIFTVTLTNLHGCDSLVIETVQFIPADTTLMKSKTCDASDAGIFINTLTNADGCDSLIIETVELLPTDTLVYQTTTCAPQDTGINVLTLTNIHGCDSIVFLVQTLAPYDTCHVIVVSRDVYVPNIFSPNGDGINDHFLVFTNSEALPSITYFRIFDRWGGLVMENYDVTPNDPNQGWDGTENGKPVNPGVYVWAINLNYQDGSSETIKGNVTLLR